MHTTTDHAGQDRWLKQYYLGRAAFSLAWVAAVLGAGRQSAGLAAILLVLYPAWDALANWVDAMRSGGLARNRSQAINVAVSVVTAIAVALALPDMHRVLAVFGAWAILAGLAQLGAALRRRKQHGAQWAMILSGAQSALAGSLFIVRAGGAGMPGVADVAGYATVGALYFLISGTLLHLRARKAGMALNKAGR